MPKGKKILVVDDDKMILDLYKERLELAGYKVEISWDGEQGIGKIHETKPDLVLLDIMMPKVNGYEALGSIKSDPQTKDIPVVILSALARDVNKSKAIEAGADDYIVKSEAMPSDVIKKIEGILQNYNKTNAVQTPQEIQFEPSNNTQRKPVATPPKAEPAETPFWQPEAKTASLNQAAPANQSVAKPKETSRFSPLVISLLIIIILLILGSDIFFYLRYLAVK